MQLPFCGREDGKLPRCLDLVLVVGLAGSVAWATRFLTPIPFTQDEIDFGVARLKKLMSAFTRRHLSIFERQITDQPVRTEGHWIRTSR